MRYCLLKFSHTTGNATVRHRQRQDLVCTSPNADRATAQSVTHRPLTGETRVQSQANLPAFYSGQSGTGHVFLQVLLFSPVIIFQPKYVPLSYWLTYCRCCGPGWLSRYSNSLQAWRSGDRVPVGTRFSTSVQTDPWVHPAYCRMDTG